MSSVFTDFVHELEPGATIEPELFEHLWEALRGTLAVEMKRRSSWQTRPSFLGIVGHGRWTLGGPGSDGLDELTSDCFEFLFIRRRTSLRRQASEKPNIDGLVHLGVQQFLLEAQSRNDPLGFHVFEVLRSTVRRLLARQQLWVLAGSSKIRNHSVLALDPARPTDSLLGIDHSPLIDYWIDTHLEALVTATHGRLTSLRETMGDELVEYLGDHGGGFRFGDLAAPLKVGVRRGWAARFLNLPGFLAGSDDEPTAEARGVESLEAGERLAEIVDCLEAFDEISLEEKERAYLDRLWRYIKAFALDFASPEDPPFADLDLDDKLPSRRKLAHFLGIPRSRFADLFGLLRRRWEICSESVGSATEALGMTSSKEDSAHRSPKGRALAALRSALADDSTTPDSLGTAVSSAELAPGDCFVAPGAEVDGVEWLVVAVEDETLRCVPVDGTPLLGAGDLELGSMHDDGARRAVRLALGLWLVTATSWRVQRTGRLDDETMAPILEAIERRDPTPSEAPLELPAYQDWLDEGPGLAHEQLSQLHRVTSGTAPRRLSESPAEPATPRRPLSRSWVSLAAAAVLLVSLAASVHLARRNAELGRLIDGLSTPIVDLPYREIQVTPRVRGPWLLEVPATATHLQIGVILVELPSYPELRIELARSSGEQIFETPPFSPRPEISLTLPKHLLGDEIFLLRVWGLGSGGEPTLLKEEEVRVIERPR